MLEGSFPKGLYFGGAETDNDVAVGVSSLACYSWDYGEVENLPFRRLSSTRWLRTTRCSLRVQIKLSKKVKIKIILYLHIQILRSNIHSNSLDIRLFHIESHDPLEMYSGFENDRI